MRHARMIFEDTPAFIPVPSEMQHRKTEIIFLPLDDALSPETFSQQQISAVETKASVPRTNGLAKGKGVLLPDDLLVNCNGEPITPNGQNFPDLSDFHATLPKQDMSAGEFCRKMRDEDRY